MIEFLMATLLQWWGMWKRFLMGKNMSSSESKDMRTPEVSYASLTPYAAIGRSGEDTQQSLSLTQLLVRQHGRHACRIYCNSSKILGLRTALDNMVKPVTQAPLAPPP
jgi:hypothetical protein